MRTDPKARSPTTAVKEQSPRGKHKCQSGASLTKKKKKIRSLHGCLVPFPNYACFCLFWPAQRDAVLEKKASAMSPAGSIKSYHETFKGFSLTAEPLQPFCSN